ncbi:hypothetical protein D3C76_1666100 [compost metagenome]
MQARDSKGLRLFLGADTWQGAGLLVGIKKSGQTVERGAVLGKGVVGLAEERQRILHLAKRLGRLHDIAQLDRPAEEARRL